MGEYVSKLTTPGHIYFIQAESGGLIKIGWATKPEARMAQMQAHGSLKLVLLHSEPGNGREEADLHRQFAAERRHGEWFEPSERLLAEIEARRGRNEPKTYEPGKPPATPDPVVIEVRRVQDRRRKPARPEEQGPTWPPPQEYWEYGNPGWDRLKRAAESLTW